ncbi:MAG: NUDIX hydrolase [Synergistaceae bacterium]|nr:NUDIX hydrolase [Synergistaceae bacterium]
MPEELNSSQSNIFSTEEIKRIEEVCVEENKIFDGKILNLRCDKVRTPSGHIAAREVVEHKPAVGMLALTNRKSVLLVRQYRYAVHEATLEICAGLIEQGEDPSQSAEREMQEELNVKAKTLHRIGEFYASPGFCTELFTLFAAWDLEESALPQDDDENVSVVEIAYKDIPAMIREGKIRDSKTFAALSWLMAKEGIAPEV